MIDRNKAAAERRLRVYAMRESGMTFPQIAKNMGVCVSQATQLYYRSVRDVARADRLQQLATAFRRDEPACLT